MLCQSVYVCVCVRSPELSTDSQSQTKASKLELAYNSHALFIHNVIRSRTNFNICVPLCREHRPRPIFLELDNEGGPEKSSMCVVYLSGQGITYKMAFSVC